MSDSCVCVVEQQFLLPGGFSISLDLEKIRSCHRDYIRRVWEC
ncbi:hypothetical protein D1AOALGA4SA_11052 [Olavius algarvensis Delta 1 endosymbiont]|nr:hypothetical protein D1AOALGA4SA_11052 [Olavius algarvensis Delta 1 endosymbiont]